MHNRCMRNVNVNERNGVSIRCNTGQRKTRNARTISIHEILSNSSSRLNRRIRVSERLNNQMGNFRSKVLLSKPLTANLLSTVLNDMEGQSK